MFITALFTNSQNMEATQVSINRQIDKKCYKYIYAMEYYSAIKKYKILPFAAMWMDLETVIQSEVIQKEKNKYHIIHLICGI